MFRDWVQGAGATGWPLVAMLVFFGAFVIVLAYVQFAMRDRKTLDEMAELPLTDDVPATPSDGGNGE